MTRLERYLSKEIGIEFKAGLYFLFILFFYCVCRIMEGNWNAGILHMTEMILLTYGMGYFQLFCLNNFDEGERLGLREVLYILLCSGIYVLIAWLGKWFTNSLLLLFFFLYLCFGYVCAYWMYKVKRNLDSKVLNEELKEFRERNREIG